MDLAIEVINYVLTAIMLAVAGAWVFLIKSMIISFRDTPYLDRFDSAKHYNLKVSVILPARNEEKFIGKCLDSLVNQDYQNYEIIAVDDSSEDSTGKIIEQYSKKNPTVIHVSAKPKPDGWIGKNWACMEGYNKSTGDLLLCTDSDTNHSHNMISLAVAHLLSQKLDALTVIPKMLCLDNWTKIALPMISTFLYTRFSALRVNNPSKKTGYFFGSFFIITRKVYESIGTHEGVKNELIEDGALGKKVKESGYKLKMVRGEHLLEAVWARDLSSLWNALKRLMVPLYLQSSRIAVAIFFAVLFLLFMPFPILIYSGIVLNESSSSVLLFASSAVAALLVYVGGIIVATKGLNLKIVYTMLAPVGSLIVVAGFLSGILHANSKSAVLWRGRTYSIKERAQDSISV